MAIKTETVTIKVTPEEKEQIKALAQTEDITVSKLLYRIIRKEIFNNGITKPVSSDN